MERIFEIAFRINGELSGSFANAIAAAQRQMRELNQRISADTQRNMSRAARAEQNLLKLYATREAINQYKNLNQAIGQNSAALVQARLRTAQLQAEHRRELQQTEQMRQSYDRLQQIYRENRGSMSSEQRAAMQEQIRAAREELRAQEARTREAGQRAGSQGRETTRLENSLSQQRQRLEELRASLQSAGVSLSEMAAHEQELEESIRRTTEELERQRNIDAARQRHSDAQTNFSYAYDNLQNAFGTAQTIMSPFVDAVKVSMDFNQRMSEVKAIIGASGEEFDMLKAKAQELGASTMFSASDVVLGMKELGKSGFDAEQINASIASNLNLAAAGELDLATSSKILSDALTMFKVPMQDYAKESEHFADVMAKSANSSNTSVELIGETMKYAGAVAGSMGYSFNDAAIATTLMAKVGLNGSMAGTALRSTFTRLVSPPKDAAAALETLGVSAVNADGSLKPFRQTLTELRKGFKGLSEADKATFATQIAGLEAMSGFLAMVDADEKTFQETVSAIDNSQGTAFQTAQEKTDNLAGAITTFQSAFEGIQIALGNAFQEPLKNFVNDIAAGLQSISQWIAKNQELVVIAGQVAAAISGIIIAIAGFGVVSTGVEYIAASFSLLKLRVMESVTALRAMSFASITSQISSMATSLASVGRAAMGFVFSPIGAVLMAIALAGYYCYTHWNQVAPVFQMLADVIGGALSTAIQTLSPAFESLGNSASRLGPAFSQIGQVIFTVLALIANVVVRVAALIITTFANVVKTVMDLFAGLGNVIASALAGDFSGAMDHIGKTFDQYKENFSKGWDDIFKGVKDIGQNLDAPLRIMNAAGNTTSGGGSFGTPQPPQPQQVDNSALIAAISTAVESSRKENSNADFSKIESALSTAIESIKQDPKADIVPQLQAISTAIESVKKENPEADTSKLESVISSVMSQVQAQQVQSAEQKSIEVEPLQNAVAQTADSMNQFAPTMTQAADGVMQMTAGQQTFNAEVQNSQATISATNAQIQASQGALSGFNAALQSTNGGLASLASSSSSAASAISGLGSAASSAVSALQSAGANAAAAVSAAAANVGKPAANFQGGIYSKGAFLTTFAEKSPEAAIPIEKTQRAKDLWTRTGQLLGLLPGKTFATEQPATAQRVSTIEQAQRQRLEQVRAQYESAKKRSADQQLDRSIVTKNYPATDLPDYPSIKRSAAQQLDRPTVTKNYPATHLPDYPSIFSGRVQTPDLLTTRTQTQPRNYDALGGIFDNLGGGGILSAITDRLSSTSVGGMLPQLLNNLPQSQSESASPIDLHFEINIAGNANAADVEEGIKQTIPLIEETFESKVANWRHEMQRREF